MKKCGRFIQFAIAATTHGGRGERPADRRGRTPTRVGVVIGSGIGGFEVIEREHQILLERGPDRVSPFFILSAIVNLAAGQVSVRLGAKGPNSAVATACTTGAHAIGDAFRLIQHGYADAMICGGTEASITPLGVAGFAAMRALSTRNDDPARASRPWDVDRDGFVVGEGAGILVLEERGARRRRGAPILAELVGYGMSADAHHLTAPPEDGDGVVRVMRAALEDAGLAPADIQYLNAHATSTPLGDKAEATAIERVFGERASRLAVSSTKSMTGHLLGGAGALEAGSDGARPARSDRAADDQPRSSRIPTFASIWCRIRPAPVAMALRDDQLVRLRRHQRVADLQACLTMGARDRGETVLKPPAGDRRPSTSRSPTRRASLRHPSAAPRRTPRAGRWRRRGPRRGRGRCRA